MLKSSNIGSIQLRTVYVLGAATRLASYNFSKFTLAQVKHLKPREQKEVDIHNQSCQLAGSNAVSQHVHGASKKAALFVKKKSVGEV
ncbi:hypothetical protein PYE51_10415 [Vibrio aestuarianus]|uniref:Uncharacterized protein n=1 Tax=Vibrio aestuarianus TaxID=28171 RepID=A0AAX3U1U7_9VIBR|nr:hypothetical protein [Vibrio aestuarianus]WGK81037.1 hypothetical protein PYE51_10415 [Vibrio aestuarianus]